MTRATVQLERDHSWGKEADLDAYPMASDVAVSGNGLIYVLSRRPSLIAVIDTSGTKVATWDRMNLSAKPHGVSAGGHDLVAVVDEGHHVVRFVNQNGDPQRSIGVAGRPSDTGIDSTLPNNAARLASMSASGGPPFNRPTKLVWAPNGDMFVSDGYGNCRVHRFNSEGELVASWGGSGTGPGEFHLPHSVATDQLGRLFVADRENDRVQLFDLDGNYLSEWVDVHRPASVAIGNDGLVYVSELSVPVGRPSFVHGRATQALSARISVFDADGHCVGRCGDDELGPGTLVSPHGIAVDADDSVYVAQLTNEGPTGPNRGAARSLLRLVRR